MKDTEILHSSHQSYSEGKVGHYQKLRIMETEYIEQQLIKPRSLFELLPSLPEKPKSLKAELIDEAFEKCNEARKKAGYPALPKRAYAIRVNTSCPTDTDAHYLLTACRRGIFSKVFFGATKAK